MTYLALPSQMSSKIRKIYNCFITSKWNSKENVQQEINALTNEFIRQILHQMKLKTSLIRHILCQMKLKTSSIWQILGQMKWKTSLNYSIQQRPLKLSSPLKFPPTITNFKIKLFIKIQHSTQWPTTLLLTRLTKMRYL